MENFNEIEFNSTDGIKDAPILPERALNTIAQKSRTHYVFYAGDPGEANQGISQISYRNGLTFVKRGVVTQVDNFAYWDRDQDDRQGMPAVRHPDPRRAGEVRQVLYAADIVDTLINLWGMHGLVKLSTATDVPGSEVKRIVKAILPTVPSNNFELRNLIMDALMEFEDGTIGQGIASDMLKAVDQAARYGRIHLARMKNEMEMHRVGKDGIASLDEPARRWIKILGLSTADFEVDTQNLHQALGQALGGSREPIIVQQAPADPNVIAAAVMAAMQHIENQKANATTPGATVTVASVFGEDKGESLIADAIKNAEDKPKKGK